MKNMRLSIFAVGFCLAVLVVLSHGEAKAQFSKPVVVFKGKVLDAKTMAPHSVKVSVREVDNKSHEITASKSNSVSGNYLVVLKPMTKYWLHLEGNGVETKDILIRTPAVIDRTVTVEEDIPVSVMSRNHTARQ
jgi:hypothetical protein